MKQHSNMIGLLRLMAAFVVVAFLAGCNGKQPTPTTVTDSLVMDTVALLDSTIYGRCGDGTAMHSLELITDKGDTLMLDVNLDSVPNVKGGMTVGDRMAVILADGVDGEKVTREVLNLTTLLGKWSALDRSFEIKEGGVVVSGQIEPKPYTEWKIYNGLLILSSDTFSVFRLQPDSLFLENNKGIFSYKRVK